VAANGPRLYDQFCQPADALGEQVEEQNAAVTLMFTSFVLREISLFDELYILIAL
jgi:hypothetical protein